MSNHKVQIAIKATSKQQLQLATLLHSIQETHPNDKFAVVLITDLSDKPIHLPLLKKAAGPSFTFEVWSPKPVKNPLSENVRDSHWLELFNDNQVLPKSLSKSSRVIVLDTELLVIEPGCLSKLYTAILSPHQFVCGAFDNRWVRMKRPTSNKKLIPHNINGGVLLLDITKAKQQQLYTRVIGTLANDCPHLHKCADVLLTDTLVLHEVKVLNYLWNHYCAVDRCLNKSKLELSGIKVLNYTGQHKPWITTDSSKQLLFGRRWRQQFVRMRNKVFGTLYGEETKTQTDCVKIRMVGCLEHCIVSIIFLHRLCVAFPGKTFYISLEVGTDDYLLWSPILQQLNNGQSRCKFIFRVSRVSSVNSALPRIVIPYKSKALVPLDKFGEVVNQAYGLYNVEHAKKALRCILNNK